MHNYTTLLFIYITAQKYVYPSVIVWLTILKVSACMCMDPNYITYTHTFATQRLPFRSREQPLFLNRNKAHILCHQIECGNETRMADYCASVCRKKP